ncbi:MAG: FeoB-associated Cys-rich membrane protein [Lachnospiraceae bacterium]|nr:FeoB-associated Cys-rich membrane protein [Lachnospiraceae bacterium]
MNGLDILLIIIIAAAVALAVRRLRADRKKGKLCPGCSDGCSACSAGCRQRREDTGDPV